MKELKEQEMLEIEGGAWLMKDERFVINSACKAYKVSDCHSVNGVDFRTKSAGFTTLANGTEGKVYSSNWYALWDIDNPSKRILGNEGWNIVSINGVHYFVQNSVIKSAKRLTK